MALGADIRVAQLSLDHGVTNTIIIASLAPRQRPIMSNLIVRNIDDDIAKALKQRASEHGISAEAEHRRILEETLMRPKKRSFLEALAAIPVMGRDEDFERVQDDGAREVFE